MKEKIGACFLLFLRVLGAAWLAFLVSLIPMYVVRGIYHNKEIENIVMAITGMLLGVVFLTILQMRDDKAHRYSTKELLTLSGSAVGIYILACLLVYLPTKNNYPIAVLGYQFSQVIGTDADGYPVFSAVLISALVFGALYFGAILLGSHIARRHHAKLMGSTK